MRNGRTVASEMERCPDPVHVPKKCLDGARRFYGSANLCCSSQTPLLPSSCAAIAGRVALVLLAGVILGVALFFLGLEYLFPKGTDM